MTPNTTTPTITTDDKAVRASDDVLETLAKLVTQKLPTASMVLLHHLTEDPTWPANDNQQAAGSGRAPRSVASPIAVVPHRSKQRPRNIEYRAVEPTVS